MKIKVIIFFLCSLGVSSTSHADYASHNFVSANVSQAKCLKAGDKASKAIGINKTRIVNNAVVHGMNSEGYSFQYACMAKIGVSYYIINGVHAKKRGQLALNFQNELKNQLMN